MDLSDGKINSNQCSFPKFISSVVSHRRSQQMVLGAVHDAVLTGIDACLNGGVALVGNISSVNVSETRALLQSSFLGGVNYEEVISYSSKDFSGNTALAYSVDGFLHGWSPHAPYTVSIEDLELLSKLGRPLAIHLAETKEEVEALQQWSGPLADVVRSISGKEILWKSDKHPVEVIASKFFGLNALAVHLNHLPEELDELIIQSGLLPVYCPRASFFLKQSSKLEHPCIRLHKKGLPVALGSDSSMVLNDSQGLSTIGDARFLVTRGHVSAAVAFEMASVAGARALGFDEEFFYLKEGPLAGLLGWNIDICSSKSPLEQLMGGDQSPRWLAGPSLGTL